MRAMVVAVMLAGCGGSSAPSSSTVCDHVRKLCGEDVPATCPKDLADLKDEMGDAYGRTMTCAAEAKSCPQVLGCFVGGGASVMERWTKEFGDGFAKAYGKPLPGDKSSDKPSGKQPEADPPTGKGTPTAKGNDDWSDWPVDGFGGDDDFEKRRKQIQDEFEKRSKEMDEEFKKHTEGDPAVLASCTDFKSQKQEVNGKVRARARWTGCKDNVVREVRCAHFVASLNCECLEDGAEKWSYSAAEALLDQRADAERVARANCRMGFGR